MTTASYPLPSARENVAAQERRVETGNHNFLLNSAKYDAREKALQACPRFKKRWERIKRLHDVEEYRDKTSGVIRHTMIMERGFRPDSWKFNGKCPESRFRTACDGLCAQFKMYGSSGISRC